MNPFAKEEETSPYSWPEFPKPESEITEYTNMEGVQAFSLKGFNPGDPAYNPAEDAVPVVQLAIFQDFKEVFAATQG
jgi:hypothetical protein